MRPRSYSVARAAALGLTGPSPRVAIPRQVLLLPRYFLAYPSQAITVQQHPRTAEGTSAGGIETVSIRDSIRW